MNKVLLLCSFLISSGEAYANWVDKTMQSMSLEEKIAQLIMPGIRLNYPDSIKEAHELVSNYHVGGILFVNSGNGFFQNIGVTEHFTPHEQQKFVEELQSKSTHPLLISQDFEWGLAMRLRESMNFPRAMTLGAVENEKLIYEVAREIGKQARSVGVHINFAPVVDVNSNPQNPVIHMRSFGEDPVVVARKALVFMQGLIDAGVVPCAKHFPGHGDTSVDSHHDLPELMHTRARLDAVDLVPFTALLDAGVPMVMTAHLHVPALDDEECLPASLSKAVCTRLLQEELGFKGIIVTDGLRMRGVTKHFTSAQAAVRAFLAGNDIILDPEYPLEALRGIKEAVEQGVIQEKDINARVEKILKLKQCLKLDKQKYSNEQYCITDKAYQLKKEVYLQAITLVRDPEKLLPLHKDERYAFIASSDILTVFEQHCRKCFSIKNYNAETNVASITEQIVILPLYGLYNSKERNYGISEITQKFMYDIVSSGKRLIIILFGTPYALDALPRKATVVVAYEEDVDAQEAAVKCCVGEYTFKGRLPVLFSVKIFSNKINKT